MARLAPDSAPGSSVTFAREYRVTVPIPKCEVSAHVMSAPTLNPSTVFLASVMSAWSNLSDVNPGNVSKLDASHKILLRVEDGRSAFQHHACPFAERERVQRLDVNAQLGAVQSGDRARQIERFVGDERIRHHQVERPRA